MRISMKTDIKCKMQNLIIFTNSGSTSFAITKEQDLYFRFRTRAKCKYQNKFYSQEIAVIKNVKILKYDTILNYFKDFLRNPYQFLTKEIMIVERKFNIFDSEIHTKVGTATRKQL